MAVEAAGQCVHSVVPHEASDFQWVALIVIVAPKLSVHEPKTGFAYGDITVKPKPLHPFSVSLGL